MEKELESKVFMINEYTSKENMEEQIKEYVKELKTKYPNAVVTKEFYKGKNILVRATEINCKTNSKPNKERERDDWYIRQRGER